MLRQLVSSYPQLNYFVRRPADVVVTSILELLGAPVGAEAYATVQYLILGVGAAALLRQCGISRRGTALGALLSLSLVAALCGPDIHLLSPAWFPIFVVAYGAALRHFNVWRVLALILAAYLLCAASGAAGPVALIIGIGLAQTLRASDAAFRPELLLITALVAACALTAPETWDYPHGARVAPITPFVTAQAMPLSGPMHFVNPLLLPSYTAAAVYFSLLAGAMAIVLLICSGWRALNVGPAIVLLGLSTITVVDAWTSGAPWSPFQSLRHAIPGAGPLLLPWEIALPLITAASVLFTLRASMRQLGAATLGAIALMFSVPQLGGWRPEQIGAVVPSGSGVAATDTPSRFVLDTAGGWAGEPGAAERVANLKELSAPGDFAAEIWSSVRPELAGAALDGSMKTRWGTGRPQQEGDALVVSFDREVTIEAIELRPPATGTDFPRGILVEGGSEPDQFVEFLRFPEWLGGLRWTSSGLPYYGPQSEVILYLGQPRTVRHLRFTLLSGDKHFDWSVSEIRLFAAVNDSH